MLPRIQQFVWEQLRQMVWLLFALANAFGAFVVAEIACRVRYRGANYISSADAADLADIYTMVSILVVIVGANFSMERGRVLELIVPVRIMRLPIPTYHLASAWVFTRALCVALTLGAMLLARQVFIDGTTELVPGTSFIYYFTVFLFLQTLVRVTAIWRDTAIPWALTVGTVIFAFTREGLWWLVEGYPLAVLGIALLGLPIAIVSIALRRRGGVYLGGLDAMPAIAQRDYRKVSEIPHFDDAFSAQSWFEWRWHGKVLPGLVLFGCCTVAGAALLVGPRSGLWQGDRIIDLNAYSLTLFGVLAGSALLTTLYLLASDAMRLRGAQTRFLHVQPIGGWLFAQARQRMLLRGTGWALLFVSIVLIGGVNYAIHEPGGAAYVSYGRPPAADLAGSVVESPAVRYVSNLVNQLYQPDPLEEWWDSVYRGGNGSPKSAPGTSRVAGVITLALIYAALLCLGNRFALLTLGVFLASFIFLEVPELMYGHDTLQVVIVGSIALTVLFVGTLGSAIWTRLLSPQVALLQLLVYIAGGITLYLIGPGNWITYFLIIAVVALFPMATPWAIVVTSRTALAVAYQARRAGGVLPARMDAAPTDVRSARRWVVGTVTVLVLGLAAIATGRTVVRHALDGEMQLSRELGIAVDSPVPPVTREGALQRGHVGALAAVVNPLHTDYNGFTNEIKLAGTKVETKTDLTHCLDEATLSPPADFLAVLNTLSPNLRKAAAQIEQLPGMSAAELAQSAPPLTDDEMYSEEGRLYYAVIGTNGTVGAALMQCMLLSIVAAEQRDAAQSADALHASARLLGMYYASRDREYIEQRAAMTGILLDSLQYTLSRVALPAGRCAEILAVLPPESSIDDMRYAMHLSPSILRSYDFSYWLEKYPFGIGRVEISAGSQIQGVLETMLNMEGLALAVEASLCNEVLVEFQNARKFRKPFIRFRNEQAHNPLRFGRVRKIRNVSIAVADGDATVSLARAVLALEIYREQHGAYPEALADLVPAILPEVPIDWLANPFEKDFTCKYVRSTPTSHRTYVVGRDRADNDGVRAIYGKRDYRGPQPVGDVVIHVNRP